MGRNVTMFFTFWGLNILRKSFLFRSSRRIRHKLVYIKFIYTNSYNNLFI
ncbi:MAG TPA: hypothetical protein DDZ89_02085 [Clostridiales bacterium]|nr:hypothetical protein [Clostridiales bacterium]